MVASTTSRPGSQQGQGRSQQGGQQGGSSSYVQQATTAVQSAPMTATLVAFGTGVAIGLIAIQALTPSQTTYQSVQSNSSSYLETIRRRVMDALSSVPDSISSSFGY